MCWELFSFISRTVVVSLWSITWAGQVDYMRNVDPDPEQPWTSELCSQSIIN
jgi:hypothetical protein